MTFYFSISVYICDIVSLSISLFKMNASSWRKAADLVAQGTQANQQVQAVATAESNQLESLPLSALSADDSGPPQVTYGTEAISHRKYTKGNFDINTRNTNY